MGEVVRFKRKKLSGFLPEETVEEYRTSIKELLETAGQATDTPPEYPDSGDCA